VQILKHLGIGKWYDLDRHPLGALEENRNYSRVDRISIEIKYIGAKILNVFAIICNKDEAFEINSVKENF
jgi:hypothetical protein